MTNSIDETVIRNDLGNTVGILNKKGNRLEARCEWYNGQGDLVVYGFFKDGRPYAGSFLNWARVFSPPKGVDKYDVEYYVQDWVTVFEAGFDSEPPSYRENIEVYCAGQQILGNPH